MFLKHQSNRSAYSVNLTLKLRTLCLEYAMNHHDSVFSLVFHQSGRIDFKQNLGNSGREEKLKLSPDCEQLTGDFERKKSPRGGGGIQEL